MFGRRKRIGHAKQMAYLANRPVKMAERAQRILENKSPVVIPPLPPRRQVPFWVNRGWMKKALPPSSAPQPAVSWGSLFLGGRKPENENKNPFNDGRSFLKRLEKKGFKRLGNGAHSQVMAKENSDKCIKVGISADNWMQYVLWGRKMGYEGNFVPKVYSYKYFKGKKTNLPFYVAVVEKLARTTNRSSANKDKDNILLDLFQPAVYDNTHAKAALNFLEPGCGDFAANLKKAANDNNWGFDIHGGNFMVRNNGTWVATDPVHSHGRAPQERIRSRMAA